MDDSQREKQPNEEEEVGAVPGAEQHLEHGEWCCRICGTTRAGRHYGSICCSGCKGFFRRSVRCQKFYHCPYKQSCTISKEYRNCCRACRFAKCLSQGMEPKLVRPAQKGDEKQQMAKTEEHNGQKDEGEEKDHAKGIPLASSSSSSSTVATMYAPSESTDARLMSTVDALLRNFQRFNAGTSSKLALGFSRSIPPYESGNSLSMASYFVSVERFCDLFVDNAVQSQCTAENNTEVPVELALKQPGLISARFAIGWSPPRRVICASMLRHIYCRTLAHYFDWASHVPELDELTEEDKRRLVVKRWNRVNWLLMAHRSVQFAISGIACGCESFYPTAPSSDQLKNVDQRLSRVCGPRFEFANDELSASFRQFGISEQEYALLRVICLFTPVARLSPDGHAKCNAAQNKYLNALTELVHRRQSEDGITAHQRLNGMLAMLSITEQLGQMDDDLFQLLNIFNMADMRGSLLYDVHVRQ